MNSLILSIFDRIWPKLVDLRYLEVIMISGCILLLHFNLFFVSTLLGPYDFFLGFYLLCIRWLSLLSSIVLITSLMSSFLLSLCFLNSGNFFLFPSERWFSYTRTLSCFLFNAPTPFLAAANLIALGMGGTHKIVGFLLNGLSPSSCDIFTTRGRFPNMSRRIPSLWRIRPHFHNKSPREHVL